jgi:serine/threonine-protein kinase
LEITLPNDTVMSDSHGPHQVAFSPDGRALVYAASDGSGVQRLYRRELARFESTIIPGTERAHTPFFSPDGEWLGFFANGELWKAALGGGTPQSIADAPEANTSTGAVWGRDNRIVFAAGAGTGLYRINASGGEREVLQAGGSVASVQLLPDSRMVLFSALVSEERRLHVMDLDSKETRVLDDFVGVQRATYLPTGHLVYYDGGGLLAVEVEFPQLAAIGPPAAVVASDEVFGVAISPTGHLAYVFGRTANSGRLWLLDRSGQPVRRLAEEREEFWYPRFSPSNEELAVISDDRMSVLNLDRGSVASPLLPRVAGDSVWTPDGAALTFPRAESGTSDIYQIGVSANASTLLVEHENPLYPHAWSPDGQRLAYYEVNPETARDIWVYSAEDGSTAPFLVTPFNERSPAFSPDGNFIAYTSDESGRDEVYVRTYPDDGSLWTVSTNGGTEPVWTRGGGELIYRTGGQVLSVRVEHEPTLSLSSPEVLFEGRYLTARHPSGSQWFDVSADGERFVMIEPDPETQPKKIQIVLNWFDELERLVP